MHKRVHDHSLPTVICLLMILAASVAGAALVPDETPAGPGEWGFRPPDGKVSAVNPPGFVWRPQKDAATYEMQIASDANFDTVIHEAGELQLDCHCPSEPLKPGTYYWRFRYTTTDGQISDWSSIRSFTVDENSTIFPMPTRQELLSRIPQKHPRLFLRPEDIEDYRELAHGRLSDRYETLVANADRRLENALDTSEPEEYPEGVTRRSNIAEYRHYRHAARRQAVNVCNGAASLAFVYLLTGDEKYAAEARRLLLAAMDWDPKGATGYRYNDEAGMPAAYFSARAYTWLGDYLSEADKEKVIAHMRVRGEQMYDHLWHQRTHIWRPYESHRNRAWHYLGEVGTAFYGDIEGAGDWVWFAMNVFFNSYPVWNDSEGGWHEGTAYWSSYMGRVSWWLATMEPTFGVDGYKKPFFSNIGDFPLYVIPPGERLGGYGDHAARMHAGRIRGRMTVFARAARNPYWQWLASKAGGEQLPSGYIGFIYGTLPPIEPKAPDDIPQSKLFPGIGLAAMHVDLVNRPRDVEMLFKSSPMGSQSHGYEAQNSFMMSVAAAPVFIRTGFRDLYGSPHHKNWMWEAKSVNTILVNNRGQKKHCRDPIGKITDFHTSEGFDYVVGEAADAYLEPVDRFTRAILFIKPEAVVIFDTLTTPEPSTYQWLLHSPNRMRIHHGAIWATNEPGAAVAQIRARQELNISQTNKFDPPPEDFVDLVQWHLTAATTEPAETMDFISVLRPYKARANRPPLGLQTFMPEGGDALGCTIGLQDGEATVVWRKSGEDICTYNGVTTDADIACVIRRSDGSVTEVFVHNGRIINCQ